MALGFDARCTQNLVDGLSVAWVKVGKYWPVPMFISNYSSSATIRGRGNEAVVSPVSTANGDW